MKKFQASILITLILISALLWAVRPPTAQAMRRESGPIQGEIASYEISPQFEEALNVSLMRGYCQAVKWEWVEA